jgi:hypothetical protein
MSDLTIHELLKRIMSLENRMNTLLNMVIVNSSIDKKIDSLRDEKIDLLDKRIDLLCENVLRGNEVRGKESSKSL